MDEIFTLEKERKVARFCKGVREAVTHIEIGRMACVTTVERIGSSCGLQLRQVERDYRQFKLINERLELSGINAAGPAARGTVRLQMGAVSTSFSVATPAFASGCCQRTPFWEQSGSGALGRHLVSKCMAPSQRPAGGLARSSGPPRWPLPVRGSREAGPGLG